MRFAQTLGACGSAPDWGQGEGLRISRVAHELECDLEPQPSGLAAMMGGRRPRDRGAVGFASCWVTGRTGRYVVWFSTTTSRTSSRGACAEQLVQQLPQMLARKEHVHVVDGQLVSENGPFLDPT